jgi:predicted DNA-binding protein
MKLSAYRLPESVIDRLEAESRRTGATKAEIVRRAINAYLERQEHGRSNASIEAASKPALARS